MKNSEFRDDYVHNRTVIIAPGRNKRPDNPGKASFPNPPKRKSPFVPSNINKIKSLLTIRDKKSWRIKVVKNIFPIVRTDNPAAYGYQEVVIETPSPNVELAELSEEHITDLLGVYATRTRELAKDKKIQYILIFKNNGGRAGASVDHAHTQIFASDHIPPHVWQKLSRAQEFQISYGQSYYQDLIKREQKGPRMIVEDEHFISLAPYASIYNYEAWILSKRPADNIADFKNHELRSLAKQLKLVLSRLNSIELPYNFYLHQVVNYTGEHFYLRIAPRRDIWAGIELGSRLYVNTVPPEDAAKFYRGPKQKAAKKRTTAKRPKKK